jgi:hypothetical protein
MQTEGDGDRQATDDKSEDEVLQFIPIVDVY